MAVGNQIQFTWRSSDIQHPSELPLYKSWGTHHVAWGDWDPWTGLGHMECLCPDRYQQVPLVLVSIYSDSTGTSSWTAQGEWGELSVPSHLWECSVCSSGTCGQLCICVHNVPVPSGNFCSASLLGWTWTWISGSLVSVTVPDSALLSDKKTWGTNPSWKLLLR